MTAAELPHDRPGPTLPEAGREAPASTTEPVLVAGAWRPATVAGVFRAVNPATGAVREESWPVSSWPDLDAALHAAVAAAAELASLPGARLAEFLERYAARLGTAADELVGRAHAETGLAIRPRLAEVELPRTLDQLRQAAAAAREGSWRMAMIDSGRNIRSAAFGLGPVVVFPPANFPLAYGAVTGGDFAAAIAAGNPVIAKAHPGHPAVSMLAAGEAIAALRETGLPAATVQLLHAIEPADGERLVADERVGATGFTGGQAAGRRLFAAAAAAGRTIWVEMGSLNPVVILPGALAERGERIAEELASSVTGSAGQFCTKPGVVLVVDETPDDREACRTFVTRLTELFRSTPPQVLLGPAGRDRLAAAIGGLRRAGARLLAGGTAEGACGHAATLLEASGAAVVASPGEFLVEAFGNSTLVVRCATFGELLRAVACVEGSLAASLYRADHGGDDAAAEEVARLLVARAGRIVENRTTTGLSVTPSMQHGGPWPSAGPPFFSAVGMPWSILRFARRICFDGWSMERLPECLRDPPPAGRPWRYVDGGWTRG